MSSIQVSAHISSSTKERLDRRAREAGQTRAHLIEQALQQYLRALEELPLDVIVPARVVLDAESAARVRDMTSHPSEPTEAMRRLFDDR